MTYCALRRRKPTNFDPAIRAAANGQRLLLLQLPQEADIGPRRFRHQFLKKIATAKNLSHERKPLAPTDRAAP